MMTTRFFTAPVVGLLCLATLTACGANAGDATIDLTPPAADGRSIARSNGCAACHGTNGEGGVGPTFVGLFGSTVELDDGTTVTADEAYLTESITDPGAKKVAGFRLPMPTNNLSDDDVAKVVAYITELAGVEATP